MPDDKLDIIRSQFIQGQVQPGSILSKVLEGLPAEDVQRLKQKAAEGMLASELQKMVMANKFQASTVDIDDFIRTIGRMEDKLAGKPLTGYDAKMTAQTASGETSIHVKKGCFIATAVYGSADHPNVLALRRFRDDHLESNAVGRAFCAVYYRLSPRLAEGFFSRGRARDGMRRLLNWFCELI
jgi:hypothetical protein